MAAADAVTNSENGRPGPQCWSCQTEIAAADRFCRACGATVMSAAKLPRDVLRKRGRRHAAVMLAAGAAIFLFAVIHRNPADVILVTAFGLPLCGAGAVTWKMA